MDLSSFNQQTFIAGIAFSILLLKKLRLKKDNSVAQSHHLSARGGTCPILPAHLPPHLQPRPPRGHVEHTMQVQMERLPLASDGNHILSS